jgi:hypothetical protein
MPVLRAIKWMAIPSVVLVWLGMGDGPLRAQEASGDAAKSAKERLSDKASDEQRVNNCRVPLEKRGTKPRPDCPTPREAEKVTGEQKHEQ